MYPYEWFNIKSFPSNNRDVNRLNRKILTQFPGTSTTYYSADFFEPGEDEDGDSETYPQEFLHRLEPHGLSVHELELKVGAPVIRAISMLNLIPKFKC